ncbi:MAG: tetratricopeptide repeat protein [Ignavibacteriae bacterium]|nr:tetratricopeptide repeat protein [Ignavibacteriota bacterium]
MTNPLLLFLMTFFVFSTAYTQTADEYIKQGFEKVNIEYARTENYKAAYDLFTKAIEMESNNAKAYYNRGLADYYIINGENSIYPYGYYGNPISDFSKAIELNPKYAKAYYNRGIAYKYMKEYLKAIDNLTNYLNLEKDDKEGYFSRGIVFYERKDYSKAILDFTKVIKMDPSNDYALYSRGLIYYFLGKDNDARQDWSKISGYKKQEADELLYSFQSYDPSFLKDVDSDSPITYKLFSILANTDDDSVFINVQNEMGIDPMVSAYYLTVNILGKNLDKHYVSFSMGEDAVRLPFYSLSNKTQEKLKNWCGTNKFNLFDINIYCEMKKFDK